MRPRIGHVFRRNWIPFGREEPGSRTLLAYLQGCRRTGHSDFRPSVGHG